jgi:peptidyl-dipeptidase A
MFEVSDEFYQSLGLPNNKMSYDESVAMIEKPEDGRVEFCYASAWDFCDRSDFRLAE